MNSHKNARTTYEGRKLLIKRVAVIGLSRAAEAAGISPDLDQKVRTDAVPAHMLALAHTTPDDAIDRRFHKASGDPSTGLLPA
jgi:hypothetical protein